MLTHELIVDTLANAGLLYNQLSQYRTFSVTNDAMHKVKAIQCTEKEEEMMLTNIHCALGAVGECVEIHRSE